jgi:hypothetical protein
MTKDETLLVFTLVVSSVSVFLFGILLFMVLISATRDFREIVLFIKGEFCVLSLACCELGHHMYLTFLRRWHV